MNKLAFPYLKIISDALTTALYLYCIVFATIYTFTAN